MELALDELKGLERGKLNISVVSTANGSPRIAGKILPTLQRRHRKP